MVNRILEVSVLRIQQRFGRVKDESFTEGGIRDDRNFNGAMQD